jgi:long-chain acyl-CoA synthetase
MEFDPVLVHEWLRRSARRYPDKDAVICGPDRLTYAELDARSDRLAAALRDMGLARHDRAVIFLDNCAETVVALYATLKAGGTFIIINGSVKGPKLRYILSDSGAGVLITHRMKRRVVGDALSDGAAQPQVVWVGCDADNPPPGLPRSSCWADLLSHSPEGASDGAVRALDEPRSIDVDLATLIYTSGSTGEPKGVMSTHHNMVSAARSIVQYTGNDVDDIILGVLPLSFDYGLYQVVMSVMCGSTIVLERSFAFLHKILQRIAEEKISALPVVPTMVAMMLRMKDLGGYDLSSLRYVTNTAAALPVQHIVALRQLLPDVRIYSMYGLTECKRVSYLPPEELDRRPGSVGKAMPNCETIILDDEGNECPPGEIGELVIRGANVMQGYWQAPEITARTYCDGGYRARRNLHSGDLFRADEEGFLYFVGRRDAMIKSKGERISPKEVEFAICNLAGVAEAAVVGVPDEVMGQAIKAVVVAEDGATVTANDVLKHCSRNLELFMVPKYVDIADDLPRTPNGKIDRKALVRSHNSEGADDAS